MSKNEVIFSEVICIYLIFEYDRIYVNLSKNEVIFSEVICIFFYYLNMIGYTLTCQKVRSFLVR